MKALVVTAVLAIACTVRFEDEPPLELSRVEYLPPRATIACDLVTAPPGALVEAEGSDAPPAPSVYALWSWVIDVLSPGGVPVGPVTIGSAPLEACE